MTELSGIMSFLNEYINGPILIALLNLLMVFIYLMVAKQIAKYTVKYLGNLLRKKEIDEMLIRFSLRVLVFLVWALVGVAALSKLGVDTTSLVAALGAAGLAVALAMQSHMSNLAAGVMIIVFRPFIRGDMIEAEGTFGKVREVDLLNTRIMTQFGQVVIVPNNKIINQKLINFTKTENLRVKINITVPFATDLALAQQILKDIIAEDDRILPKPKPRVHPLRFSENGVVLTVRPWTTNDKWWFLQCEMIEEITKRFTAAGIYISYPQRDVHFHQFRDFDGSKAEAMENAIPVEALGNPATK